MEEDMNTQCCDDCCEAMPDYIGVKIVQAIRQPCPADIHNSKKGDPGYKVVYEDGYESWSPADVFNKAYRVTNAMSFGLAIEAMRKGKHVCRRGWNGRGIFIAIQTPDKNSKMTSPYIYIDTTGLITKNMDALKSCVPWIASQSDMLADDWIIV